MTLNRNPGNEPVCSRRPIQSVQQALLPGTWLDPAPKNVLDYWYKTTIGPNVKVAMAEVDYPPDHKGPEPPYAVSYWDSSMECNIMYTPEFLGMIGDGPSEFEIPKEQSLEWPNWVLV